MSEITKEDAYLRFNKELMKTVRVVAAVIKTVNENGEPIIFLDDCDAHLAESLFQTCSRDFAPYIGFTEAEVMTLAEKYNQDYEKKITGGTNHGTFLFYPTRADRVEC